MEPPSESLQQLLAECGLCRRGELRRCRGRVRRLVHDLPAFDSVWIDALLQARVLTGYQARVLSSNDPGRLRVGPCVLLERLGGGRWSETCLGEVIGQSRERRVLKRLVVPSDILEGVTSRLNDLVGRSSGVDHPGIVAPRVVNRSGRELVLASRYVDGPSLRDLLVRRGRFPSDVVEEIGRGLVEALGEFDSAGLVHGDLMVGNIRLGADGQAVAVDAGVAVAVEPRLVVDLARGPDRYDGIAPERVATSGAATCGSDMYALGCLLFELLAGRPPFPVADVVMKLNAHQGAPVADVRDWAPDVSPGLAERVNRLCAHEASDRPSGWREARQEWRTRRGRSHRQSRRFRRELRSAAPAIHVAATSRPGRVSSGVVGTVVAVVLAAVAWSGQQWIASNGPAAAAASTSMNEQVAEPSRRGTGALPEGGAAGSGWPVRGDDGTLRLETSTTRSGVRLEDSESLVLVGGDASRGVYTEIVIEPGQPLELHAPRVELHGLSLRGPAGEPWVVIHGGAVRIVDCRFVAEADPGPTRPGVAVEVVDRAEHGGVLIELTRVMLYQLATGVGIRAAEAEVVAEDVLQVAGGSLLEWQRPDTSARGSLVLDLSHCTLRRSRRLLAFGGGAVRIESEACVLAIRSGGVLCESTVAMSGSVRIRGNATLLTPGAVVTRGRGDVEGLVAAVPTFGGPASIDARDSELSRLPAGVPGVDGSRPGIRVRARPAGGVDDRLGDGVGGGGPPGR